jgi:hypothetical protein
MHARYELMHVLLLLANGSSKIKRVVPSAQHTQLVASTSFKKKNFSGLALGLN